jgi:exoribonuclease II
MLADEVVTRFSLQEGQTCPALSLYLTIDETTLGVLGSETRLEQVTIKANLRHDRLDEKAQPESLQTVQKARDTGLPFADELVFLFRLAQVLKLQREAVRGKPEVFNRPDYSFRLDGPALASGHAPNGSESVTIVVRRRGAPLDLIVAECMILANATWGAWLSQCGVPGIYRSQASLLPGVKVRMGTKALPHAGIGVAQYAWSTSPLRRYCDLVNQWQLLACVRHGPTAALVAPFRPKDAALMAVISAFDAAYTAYADFQATVERFWTLRCLQQGSVTELTASVMSHGRVRADDWPLVFSLAGAEALPRGARLSVKVVSVNLLTLELHAQTLSRIDDVPATEAAEASEDDEAPDVSINLALDVLDDDQPAAGPAGGGPAQSR